MKTESHPSAHAPVVPEEEIRAYAAHLFEQSGRMPNRDVENWLEAKACLEANLRGAMSGRKIRRENSAKEQRPRGFTMPASDASLWVAGDEGD